MTLIYSWLEIGDDEAIITVQGSLLALHGCRDSGLNRQAEYTIRLQRAHNGNGPWVCSPLAHRPASLVPVPEDLRQRLVDVVVRQVARRAETEAVSA